MTDEEIKQHIIDFMLTQNYLDLATVTHDGRPLSHTLAYVSEGDEIFFATRELTRKIENIRNSPSVAFTINDHYKKVSLIHGIQASGTAEILSDEKEIKRARGLLMKKFHFLVNMPFVPDLLYVRIRPAEVFYLDYTDEEHEKTIRTKVVF